MASGSCNCGSVTFDISAPLTDVIICHCSICRRLTGGSGFAVVKVNNDDFRWCSGQEHIRYWVKPGHDWHTHFCGNCGSPLPGINDESSMFVPVGLLLSGTKALRVAHHIWVGSKADWDIIGDQGKQHPTAYTD